jgi:DNA-directed RNA polymerase subunit RPC12/RpoP
MSMDWNCTSCRTKVDKLNHTPNGYVCDECVPEELVQRGPSMRCSLCGNREIFGSGSDKDVARFRANQMCFSCDHFYQLIPIKDEPTTVRVEGRHYMIAPDLPERTDSWHAGHGGALFRIQFNDGRYAESRNLWCQGDIPEHFRTQLPDNATFLPITLEYLAAKKKENTR